MLTEQEIQKSIAYTAISMKKSVCNGQFSFEKAKSIILRDMNMGLPPGKLHDITKYFDPSIYSTNGDTPEWVGKELSSEAWEAFEYFNLI